MKPADLHRALQRLSLSYQQFAAMVGVHTRSVDRWCNGVYVIPPMVVSIIGLLEQKRITPESFVKARTQRAA